MDEIAVPAGTTRPRKTSKSPSKRLTQPGTRLTPYQDFKFVISFDAGKPVAGMSKMSLLKRSSEVVEPRSGGDPGMSSKSPRRNKYDAITLERGVTYDSTFQNWASLVWNYGAALGSEVSLANFRKNIILDFFDEVEQNVERYKFYRCWVSEYQSTPDLDANANAIAIQHIKVENEGWARDTAVKEPKQREH
jgi:phage tail-like protein